MSEQLEFDNLDTSENSDKAPLVRFIEGLSGLEVELLTGYLEKREYDILSKNFDRVLAGINASKTNNN